MAVIVAFYTFMPGRSCESGMVIVVDMDGFSHIFAYGMHMRDARTDVTARTSLAGARYRASVQCVALTSNSSVFMSVALDGSLVAWAARLGKDCIGSAASGSVDHRQALATDDDDDDEVDSDV